jgi:cell division septum initiation protein DivIVA
MQGSIDPDEITADRLPRAYVGGYAVEKTEELLRRASWDYRQLLHDYGLLSEEVELLHARVVELEQEGEGLRAQIAASENRAERVGAMINAAGRAARETRENARLDAELVLKKARRRAAKLEKALAKARSASAGELSEFARRRERIRADLREYLEAALVAINYEDDTNGPDPNPGEDLLDSLLSVTRPGTDERAQGTSSAL